jgi:hypothetical protein
MTKKSIIFSLIAAILLLPATVFATHTPLESEGKQVYLSESEDATVVSYMAFLRVRTGFTSVNTSMVVKNKNPDNEIELLMGIPTQVNEISKIRSLSVRMKGEKINVGESSSLADPPNGKNSNVKSWFTWTVTLGPGESSIIECDFSIDNRLEQDGTQIISFPLEYLKNWANDIDRIQIIADLDYYAAHVFEPSPSPIPQKYDEGGRLTWTFHKNDSLPSEILLSFKPTDLVTVKYLETKASSDDALKEIINLYQGNDLDTTIESIDNYLDANPDAELEKELNFLKALCLQDLYLLEDALTILDDLETDPGFGNLSDTMRNKIICDKVSIYKDLNKDETEIISYLESVKSQVQDNKVFMMWVEDEINRMTPAPAPVEEESIPETEADEEDDVSQKTIEDVELFGYKIPIEILIIAVIIIIVIIYLIFRPRRKRYGSSIFR